MGDALRARRGARCVYGLLSLLQGETDCRLFAQNGVAKLQSDRARAPTPTDRVANLTAARLRDSTLRFDFLVR